MVGPSERGWVLLPTPCVMWGVPFILCCRVGDGWVNIKGVIGLGKGRGNWVQSFCMWA